MGKIDITPRFVEGNDTYIRADLYESIDGSESPLDLSLCDDIEVRALPWSGVIEHLSCEGVLNGLVLHLPASLPVGLYSLQVTLWRGGNQSRCFDLSSFRVVRSNKESNVHSGVYSSGEGDIRIELSFISQVRVNGKDAFELWKELPGNEGKTRQNFIDEYLDLSNLTASLRDAEGLRVQNERTRVVNEEARELKMVQFENAERERSEVFAEVMTEAERVNAVLSGTTLTVTDRDGVSSSVNVKGADGAAGSKGDKGDKGDTGATGAQGAKGDKGDKGDQGNPGVGVPVGGSTGQVLAKKSGSDYDTEWVEQSGGYEPPVGGIPKTDLAADVQTSLGKADTALQSSDISGKADKPLVIEVEDGDTEVPSGTFASITAALAEGRDVVVKVDEGGECAHYNLAYDSTEVGDGYTFVFSQSSSSNTIYIDSDDACFCDHNNLSHANHTHGAITNGGSITFDTSIANGDKIVITDASSNSAIKRSDIAFDGSTTTKALTLKGTWETFYQKPSGGIPASDLASAVQTSLGKADTAIQDVSDKQDVIDSSHKLSADLVEDGTTNKSYTATEKTKLAGIAAGAEVNVQANWNETSTSSDAYIQNKPTDLAHIGDTQGSATIANFDPLTDTVHITAQTLSSSAQAQARANIGAGTSNFSGSYNDLTNKPTIPDAVSGTNDGTNWTSITIGSTTKAIPSGGGGGGGEANVIESISINGTTQTVTSKNVDLPVPVSSVVEQIVSISQNAYDALSTKDSATLYLITS